MSLVGQVCAYYPADGNGQYIYGRVVGENEKGHYYLACFTGELLGVNYYELERVWEYPGGLISGDTTDKSIRHISQDFYHRVDGPAIEFPDEPERNRFFLRGKEYFDLTIFIDNLNDEELEHTILNMDNFNMTKE